MSIILRNSALVLAGLLLALAVAFATPVNAFAQSDDDSSSATRLEEMMKTIKSLLAQVEELQKKLGQVRNEIKVEIRQGLREGMTDEDIKKIQEVLASDTTLYPEGLVTGYFGSLTKRALERFQTRFELEVTGEMDDETRAAFETLLEERFGEGKVPPGLLNAPGIKKKFEDRLRFGCEDNAKGVAPFCIKVKNKYKWDDAKGDDDKDDEDEEDAQEQIDKAQAVIDALEDAIDDADASDDRDDAEDALEAAKAKLALAQDAFDDEDYEEAEELAEAAEEIAEDAYEDLTGEEFDDEDDD